MAHRIGLHVVVKDASEVGRAPTELTTLANYSVSRIRCNIATVSTKQCYELKNSPFEVLVIQS